jgi:MHS family proline/betaine transporter-like MFS transporter
MPFGAAPPTAQRQDAPAQDRSPLPPSHRHLLAAGIVGNLLEWYDFSIYGYFAPIIGRHFFPSHDPATSLVAAFGVFSAGFLTRPFGAALFGWIGDRYGREHALMASILAMALPTALTGLMPDYRAIGPSAAVLMVIMRLIQGLSAGGEYTTSIVFLAERSANGRRGLMASAGLFGSIAGGMLGSGVGAFLGWLLAPEALEKWGWRLPFVFGIALAACGGLIRREMVGLPQFDRPKVSQLRVIAAQWRAMLLVGGFEIFEGVGFYTVFIFLATYVPRAGGLSQSAAFAISTAGLGSVLAVIPAAAALSDRFGRKPIMLAATISAVIFAWPLFRLLGSSSLTLTTAAQLALAAIVGLYEGATPAAATEAFPQAVRCIGVALAFNLTMMVFGGTTPAIATLLIDRSGSIMAPAVYLAFAAAISGIVVLLMPETAELDFTDPPRPNP